MKDVEVKAEERVPRQEAVALWRHSVWWSKGNGNISFAEIYIRRTIPGGRERETERYMIDGRELFAEHRERTKAIPGIA